jgi:hypothetical protein
MINPTTLALMQRLADQHGQASGNPGYSGSSVPNVNVSPAGGGQPSAGGGLSGLLSGLTAPFQSGRAQYAPDQGQATAGDGSGLLGGFGDKLADFGVGAALGGKNWYQTGLTGLYTGIASRREEKKAQAQLNRTRDVAIKMGVDPEIAANAPPEVLLGFIKEATAAGFKPITLSKGEKAFDPKGSLIADNPADPPKPEKADLINLMLPGTDKVRSFDRNAQRDTILDYIENRGWREAPATSSQPPNMQTKEIDGVVYNWNPQTGELGKPLGKSSSRQQAVPQAVQSDLIKTKQAYGTINNALDRFENAALTAGTYGSTMPGAEKDAVSEERRNVQLQMKELYNLGVLNGPDLELMDTMLFDPALSLTDPLGNVSKMTGDPGARVKASVARMKQRLKEMVESKIKVVGDASKNTSGQPAMIEPPADVDPAVWEVMTPEEQALWQTSH